MLRVFDNRVLRRVFRPQENLLTEDWKIIMRSFLCPKDVE
jgi:hypothetical protein